VGSRSVSTHIAFFFEVEGNFNNSFLAGIPLSIFTMFWYGVLRCYDTRTSGRILLQTLNSKPRTEWLCFKSILLKKFCYFVFASLCAWRTILYDTQSRRTYPLPCFYKETEIMGGQSQGRERFWPTLNRFRSDFSHEKKLGGEARCQQRHCLIIQSHGYEEWRLTPTPDPQIPWLIPHHLLPYVDKI